MYKFLLVLLSLFTLKTHSQSLQTTFEKSNGKETVTYEEGIAFWKELAKQYENIRMLKMGLTDSGEPLHLILYNSDKVFDISTLNTQNKPILLINNAIHAGETDGVDASMMLLRNFARNKGIYPFLDDIIIAVIPFYNIGGVLNRNTGSRVNQNGPEAYGFRGNARNYDLNRDFIKMDSKNAFALIDIIQQLDPEVFVDTHVTNGSDHQHVLTLISTQHNKLGGELGEFLENSFESQIFNDLSDKNRAAVVYVNVHGSSPNDGWPQFWDASRYSSGYNALFQTLGFISESHMWKPYKERVENTYDYLETMVKLTAQNSAIIQQKRALDRAQLLAADSLSILWENNPDKYRMVNFKGYKTSMPINELTGNPLLSYDRKQPFEKEVPFYNSYLSKEKVSIPEFYIIPQQWTKVIERLQANKVTLIPLKKDSIIKIEAYKIASFETSKNAYEGHYLHFNTTVEANTVTNNFRKGDFLVPTNQLAKRYIVETLEPAAQDSFFNWNFFDTILQQKEGFSDYVFAEKANAILKQLTEADQKEFNSLKENDETFKNSNYAQLDWIYKRSHHYEEAHMQYPIYRLMTK